MMSVGDLPAIGPIDWGADPQLTERALSVLLLQRQSGWRRRPSHGDGGVDVVRILGDGYEVIQIKSHTTALSRKQRNRVAEGLRQVIDDPELDRPVVAWRLLVPVDPTKEAERWFREMTADAPFDCSWWGRAHVDGLAAAGAHVVDWYFRDGRDRLEARMRDLHRAVSILDEPHAPLRADEALVSLEELIAAVNRDDPHYRYYFEHSPEVPTLAGEGERPGIVLAVSRSIAAGGYLTTRVFARHPHATEERPVPVTFALTLPVADDELRQQVEEAFAFGSDVVLPPHVVKDLYIGAPGGLDRRADEATLRIAGLDDEPFTPFRLRMRAISPDGSPLAETTVEVTRRTRGTRGLDLHLAEIEGTFRIVARLDPIADEALVLRQFDLGDAGQPASRILAGCRLLHALHAPNRLLLLAEHGEQQLASFDIHHVEPPVPDSYLAVLEQLDTVQQHTFVTVRAPEQFSRREARELGHAHNLLTGQPSGGRWHDLSIGVRASDVDDYLTRVLAGPGLAVEQPLRLNLAHQVIDFKSPVHPQASIVSCTQRRRGASPRGNSGRRRDPHRAARA
jgi:hypothetical protein